MKVYSVKPGSQTIRVSDGRELTSEQGAIAWGDASFGAFLLSREILTDVLKDKNRASKLAQRFKYRTVKEWPKDAARAITEKEVLEVVTEIEKVEADLAPMIARQQRERPMFVTDAAGPGQVWDKNPDIKPKEKIDGASTSGGNKGKAERGGS